MTFRAHALVLALVAIAACAGVQRDARLREQLDAYSIPKPLSAVWPEALRYINDRGYELVGKDRLAIGGEDEGLITKFLNRGHETQQVSGRQWVSETKPNSEHRRYRLVGLMTGAKTCQVQFYSLTNADANLGLELDAPDREYRDVQLELDFVETFDAASAEKMMAAANH